MPPGRAARVSGVLNRLPRQVPCDSSRRARAGSAAARVVGCALCIVPALPSCSGDAGSESPDAEVGSADAPAAADGEIGVDLEPGVGASDAEDDLGTDDSADSALVEVGPFECPTGPTVPVWPTPPPGAGDLPAFDDVTTIAGLDAALFGHSASWADVNGDGWEDLWIPFATGASEATSTGWLERKEALWLNCGGTFVPAGWASRVDRGSSAVGYSHGSEAIDLDDDGLLDLVATGERLLSVFRQVSPGRFETWEHVFPPQSSHPWMQLWGVLPWDMSGDGRTDLFVTIYGARNSLWLQRADGGWTNGTGDYPGLIELTDTVSYGASVIVGPPGRARPVLYVASDGGANALPDYALGFASADAFDVLPLEPSPESSMGLDFAHLDDGETTLIAVGQTDGWPLLSLRGESLMSVADAMSGERYVNTWAVQFEDFDRDGHEDLLYPSGQQDTSPAVNDQTTATLTTPRLLMMHAEPTTAGPRFVDRSAAAGPAFDGTIEAHFMSAAVADFDRDGCADVIVGPVFRYDFARGVFMLTTPFRLLRNRCTYSEHWIGVDLPDRRGTLVTLRGRDAEGAAVARYREIRASTGTAARSATNQIRFSLAGIAEVGELEVRCYRGPVVRVPASDLSVDEYNDLRELCR